MFFRAKRLDLIFSALFIVAMGACSGAGGCGGCSSMEPLPGGTLPAAQTVEGGAQIRVTPHGLGAITEVVKPLLLTPLTAGICLPKGEFAGGVVGYCDTRSQCGNNAQGCLVKPAVNSFGIGQHPTNAQIIRAHVDANLPTTNIPLHILIGTCNTQIRVDHLIANLDVTLGVDGGSGELSVTPNAITDLTIPDSGIHISSNDGIICSGVVGLVSLLKGLLNGTIVNAIKAQLSPAITTAINTLLPDPLGIEGKLDIGSLLAGISPGTQAKLEARVLPGGYVHMQNGGLSLGVVTGINADSNPATRTGAAASEPVSCVPALPPPNLGATGLPLTPRQSYRLDVAEQFDGVPDPQADVAIGLSETMLDLAGHHLVTSGALCLGVGTAFVPQLNVGTISIFVRSLGEIGSTTGTDPLLLVTRPQRAIDFSIGDNTAASPALTIGLDHLEVDFYAFAYERYVRVFTLDLSLNVGVNLDIDETSGTPMLSPMLLGIDANNVTIKVLNSEFVRENPADLEALLPSVFSLVTPLLGDLPAIAIPSFAGIKVKNLSIKHVTTNQDDFLAINGELDPTSILTPALAAPAAARSTATARLTGVTTPAAERIRGALLKQADGALPRVTFDVDHTDAAGRELEWSYRLDNGLWRNWSSASPLVIEDAAFAWQGKYKVGLKSRVKGDGHTVSTVSTFPVVIDSVAPRILTEQARLDGDTYQLSAVDVVSGRALQYAYGAPGKAPASAWTAGATMAITEDTVAQYGDDDGQLVVHVKDELGNTATAQVAPFHGTASKAGCACDSRTTPSSGTLLLVLAVGFLVLRKRPLRTHALRALWAGGALFCATQPGCSCNNAKEGEQPPCEVDADCPTTDCAGGSLAFCVDQMCQCANDIPVGRLGPYSDVAAGPDGAIWVSAYAQTYGDLVVAKVSGAGRIDDAVWEWVDGVPAGPVVVPGASVRGGISDHGTDVGMYTSIAVAPDGTPMVSYFDRDTASLKLAQKVGGTWQTHVVDAGTGAGDKSRLIGMYTSLTLRGDDGRPGIAYLAHVTDENGSHAEVRFASAQVAHPAAAADWQTLVVDTAALPPVDPDNPSIYPLPEGLGLFIDSARLPNQAPVVTYYDRANGDLKVARFDVAAGKFAAPVVLDGSGGFDAGWSPSIAVDAQGVVHVAYVGATADDLKYATDAAGARPEVIDDGLRFNGTTVDGLDKPELHFVGDDASIVLTAAGPVVAYQDATTQELLVARKGSDGKWMHTSIAGATDPWPGGYGFFAASAVAGSQLVMSSWVINLPRTEVSNSNWVEVFTQPLVP